MKYLQIFKADQANLAGLYGEGTAEFYRAVFLSNLGRSFATLLILAHGIILFPGTSFMDTQTKLWLAPFVAVLVSLLAISARLVESGKQDAARKLTNFTISASTMISVIICGGFISSHVTPFLLAPIIVCFCISPRNEAIVVGVMTFFTPLIVDLALRLTGVELPNLTSTANPAVNVIFLMVTLFVTIFISLSFLQKTNEDLHTALDKEKRVFENWALLDPLTEVGNRRYLDAEIEKAISQAKQYGEAVTDQFSILFIDLNGFKEINDHMGHEAGDMVLRTIAHRLKDVLGDGDHLARFGGDEFVMLLANARADDADCFITSKLNHAIEQPITVNGEQYRLGASIGKAVFPNDADTPAELIRAADMDMYAIKMANRLANRHEQIVSQQETALSQTK